MGEKARKQQDARIALLRKELGDRLAKARRRAGMTQAVAAGQVGLSDETLSRLERGAQGVSIDALVRLADAYDVSPAELLGGAHRAEEDSAKALAIRQVVNVLRRQPADRIVRARDVLQAMFRNEIGRPKKSRSRR